MTCVTENARVSQETSRPLPTGNLKQVHAGLLVVFMLQACAHSGRRVPRRQLHRERTPSLSNMNGVSICRLITPCKH